MIKGRTCPLLAVVLARQRLTLIEDEALNITLTTSADSLDFGLVGCRRSVPHLQRLLGHLETALQELEQAVGGMSYAVDLAARRAAGRNRLR